MNYFIAGLFLFLLGCTYYQSMGVSTVTLGPRYEKPIKPVTGESSALYIFFLGPLEGDASLDLAMREAKTSASADGIINVIAERTLKNYFGIVQIVTTKVQGMAVKYFYDEITKDMPPEPVKK